MQTIIFDRDEGKGKLILSKYASVEWRLTDGRFSASGYNEHPRTGGYAGQCLESLLQDFPESELLKRIYAVWKEWHLNDMIAGSPAQEAHLKNYQRQDRSGQDHYTWACAELERVGLNPDPGYEHNGKPYKYGSAWLRKDLPIDVIAEINYWHR